MALNCAALWDSMGKGVGEGASEGDMADMALRRPPAKARSGGAPRLQPPGTGWATGGE